MNTAEFKTHTKNISDKKLATKNFSKDLTILAEGDSWFDYPTKRDIIDHLRKMGYGIHNMATLGDTLENMVYGTEIQKAKGGKIKYAGPKSWLKTKSALKKYKPRIFLLSAGGNDIVGNEILGYLNHKVSGVKSPVNKLVFESKVKSMMRTIQQYLNLIKKTSPQTHIYMHGYDYAKASGKAFKFIFNLAGPWILPSMVMKGITSKDEQEKIIKYLVDTYNKALKALAKKNNNFHHVELRGKFPNLDQWHNEIHLNNPGFGEVAKIIHEKITKVMGFDPLKVS